MKTSARNLIPKNVKIAINRVKQWEAAKGWHPNPQIRRKWQLENVFIKWGEVGSLSK